jgi:hypothetical protein
VEGFWVELHGRVVDEDGAAVSGAVLTVASEGGASVAEVRTNFDGEWRLPMYGTENLGNRLVVLVRAEGFAEGRATFEVNLGAAESKLLRAGPVQTWAASSRSLPTLRLATDVPTANVSGRVLDAVTGTPISGIPLSIQVGWNANVGDPAVGATVSGSGGEFSFQATRAGMYTVTAAPTTSWGGARFPAFLTGSGGRAVGVVGPPVGPGEVRAALSWGESPFDLDLHVSAPLKGGIAGADGTGQFHLYQDETTHPDGAEGDAREAWMERVDADGLGPESAWIAEVASEGELRLTVVDADNRSDPDSTALGDSGAVLQLWFGEDTPRYWTVSPGEVATSWRPVEVDVASYVTYSVEIYDFGVDPADPRAF